MKHLTHKLAAAMTVGALSLMGTEAHAVDNLKTITDNMTDSAQGIPSLISAGSYCAGSGLAFLGVMKLKNHVDNPTQTPMKDGVARLGVGGLLLGLPFLAGTMQGSMDGGSKGNLDASTTDIGNNFGSYK